jgi:hypothetical protein
LIEKRIADRKKQKYGGNLENRVKLGEQQRRSNIAGVVVLRKVCFLVGEL